MNWVKNLSLPNHFALGVGVFLTVLIIVILSKKLYEPRGSDPNAVKKGASFVKKSADTTFACQQSDNPLMALTQANYAMAYLNIARSLALDDELTDITKIPIEDLYDDIEREQATARERILKLCPQVGGASRAAKNAGYAPTRSSHARPQPLAPTMEQQQQQPLVRQPIAASQGPYVNDTVPTTMFQPL